VSWLRLDDRFNRHAKFAGWSPTEKWGLVELLLYCASHRSSRVPEDISLLPRGVSKSILRKAEASGFLDRNDSGLSVHDWDIYNAQSVEERIVAYLATHPNASANEVCGAVGGKRSLVLRLVKALNEAGSPEPKREPPREPEIGTKSGSLSGTGTGTHARAPLPSPKGERGAKTSVGGGDGARPEEASPPTDVGDGTRQGRPSRTRTGAAILEAEEVAVLWNGGDSDAFAEKLDAISRAHRATIPSIERERLWELAFRRDEVPTA